MSGTLVGDAPQAGARDDLAAEEAALARRAAAGNGAAFAELYERYERRVFNLCYRITGSYDDAADATQDAFLKVLRRLPKLSGRELVFGSYLFTAARNASYDAIGRRKRAEPSDELPEDAAPIGAGPGGGAPPNPGDPGQDPDRNVLVAAQQEEIRAANATLPARQREVLALRELEELSYDEIAAIMGMNRNSVAQLISRARLNLRRALEGTALRAIAPSSSACERGMSLLAMRQDRQLGPDGDDDAWLDQHLAGCHTCRLSQEAMHEAGASYRAWAPVAAAPWLLKETMARAAEQLGADWSEAIAARSAAPVAAGAGWRRPWAGHSGRDLLIAAALAAALLPVAFATSLGDDRPQPRDALPAAQEAPALKRDSAKRNDAGENARSKAARFHAERSNSGGEGVRGGVKPAAAPAERATRRRDATRPDRARRTRQLASGAPAVDRQRSAPGPVAAPTPTPPAAEEPPVREPSPKPPRECHNSAGIPVRCPPRR